MLLKLSGRGLRPISPARSDHAFLGRVTERLDYPGAQRAGEILRVREPVELLPPGFRAYLLDHAPERPPSWDAYVVSPSWRYLANEDIVRIEPARCRLSVLYRRSSPSNSLLVTERCDNYCLMCSQPPCAHDDSWLIDEILQVIPLMSQETREIGITGGEPGLLGARLIQVVEELRRHLPDTAVHVLSNGRSFSDPGLARALGAVAHPDLMVGVPLYADIPEEHDYVVQARGAFDQTIAGILNLKRARVRVELRFVIQAQTQAGLPAFATFVARNLRFVDHVALMGLELVGFAKANLDLLWVDPIDYREELKAAAGTLIRAGLRTSIYNLPLCVVPDTLHSICRKSISDWKNHFCEECHGCARRADCGGLFASADLRQSRGIRPFSASAV